MPGTELNNSFTHYLSFLENITCYSTFCLLSFNQTVCARGLESSQISSIILFLILCHLNICSIKCMKHFPSLKITSVAMIVKETTSAVSQFYLSRRVNHGVDFKESLLEVSACLSVSISVSPSLSLCLSFPRKCFSSRKKLTQTATPHSPHLVYETPTVRLRLLLRW